MRGLRVVVVAGAVVLLVAAVLYLRSGDTGSENAAAAGGLLRAPQASSRGLPKGPSMVQAPSTGTEPAARVEDRLARLRDKFEHRPVAAANRPPSKREVPALDPRIRAAMERDVDADDDADEDPREMDGIRQTLLSDPDPDERVGAALMLTGEEGPESMRMLLEAMDDPDPEVRLAVVEALGDRAEELSPATLRAAIRDPNAEVRFEAVTVLGDIGNRDARKLVESAVHDQDGEVSDLARSLLEEDEDWDEEQEDLDDLLEDQEDALADRQEEAKGGPPPHVSSRR